MAVREKFDGWRPDVEYPQKGRVKVNGTEQLITITENGVMFEGQNGIWGFDRSSIRAVKLVKDEYAWNIAYSVNGEIRSVKVEVVAWWLYTTEAPKYLLPLANALYDFVSEEDHSAAHELDRRQTRIEESERPQEGR
jgi:hypothetical protein